MESNIKWFLINRKESVGGRTRIEINLIFSTWNNFRNHFASPSSRTLTCSLARSPLAQIIDKFATPKSFEKAHTESRASIFLCFVFTICSSLLENGVENEINKNKLLQLKQMWSERENSEANEYQYNFQFWITNKNLSTMLLPVAYLRLLSADGWSFTIHCLLDIVSMCVHGNQLLWSESEIVVR